MTEQDFLAGILSAPREPERWLILADWLEDHGDPRAELARLRYLLHSEPDHPETETRLVRQMQLLDLGLAPVVPTWTNFAGMPFALILPGTFRMGSPEEEVGRLSTETLHTVTLTMPYLMGIYPVTRGEFRAFIEETNYNTSAEVRADETTWRTAGFAQDDRHPVVNVSWDDAQELVRWLNRRDPGGARHALPSEAQWEYACRAGSTRAFFWGDDRARVPEFCWTLQNSGETTHAVDTLRPNPWGLHHLHGMVWEWCEDMFRSLSEDPAVDPLLLEDQPEDEREEEDRNRISRGGSFDHDVGVCRAACRGFDEPYDAHNFDGIRLVVTLAEWEGRRVSG